jgi:hypothetical protein
MTQDEDEEALDEDELIKLAEAMEEDIDIVLEDIKETKNTAQQIRQSERVGINAQVALTRRESSTQKKRKRGR